MSATPKRQLKIGWDFGSAAILRRLIRALSVNSSSWPAGFFASIWKNIRKIKGFYVNMSNYMNIDKFI